MKKTVLLRKSDVGVGKGAGFLLALWAMACGHSSGVRLRMLLLRSLKSVKFPFFSFYECGVETLSLLHHVLISVLHLSMN